MSLGSPVLLRMLRAGLLMCVGPLAFDVCASIYAGRVGIYAPFLYPMFFVLGVIFVIQDMRKKRRYSGDT